MSLMLSLWLVPSNLGQTIFLWCRSIWIIKLKHYRDFASGVKKQMLVSMQFSHGNISSHFQTFKIVMIATKKAESKTPSKSFEIVLAFCKWVHRLQWKRKGFCFREINFTFQASDNWAFESRVKYRWIHANKL